MKYRPTIRDGKPCIETKRGLLCSFEAGYQQTRVEDCTEVLRVLNSAPDLLEACETALQTIDYGYPQANAALEVIRAAIAKAKIKCHG